MKTPCTPDAFEKWNLSLTCLVNVRKSLSSWRTDHAGKPATDNPTLQRASSDRLRKDNRSTETRSNSASKTQELRQRLSRMFDGPTEAPISRPTEQEHAHDIPSATNLQHSRQSERKGNTSNDYTSSNVSLHSLPLQDVPNRKSSLITSKNQELQDFPSWRLASPSAAGKLVPIRGRTKSPVKRATTREGISSDRLRRSTSRTFLRARPPIHVLEYGTHANRRLQICSSLTTSMFVGGSTLEGLIKISIDQHDNGKPFTRPLLISKLSVDVLGFEEVNDGRKHVFLALASDLFDDTHPPPQTIVRTPDHLKGPELFWTAKPGTASIPFCINLPLNLGPAPYSSRQARIRYVVLATLVFKDGNSRDLISHSCDVQMLTVYDPQKALASLPSPLIASETALITGISGPQSVKLTCGLHRQIWVSGSLIFVDIHVINKSPRLLRKIDVQVQKVVLWYTHAAAGTIETNANHLRIPQQQDSEVVASTSFKKGKEWQGISPHSSDVCTRHIQIPRRDVTVSMGRFFEVRYFLNVSLAISLFKNVVVQLPVAASIEAKRSKTLPLRSDHPFRSPYHQGQAFIASQKLSLDAERRRQDSNASSGIEGLKRDIDRSPRKCQPHHKYLNHHRGHSDGHCLINFGELDHRPNRTDPGEHRLSHESDCYHCHIHYIAHNRKQFAPHLQNGPVLPQLQVSTSGLDFTESEFTVSDPSPRKVMLSEHERKMINQQRELQRRADFANAEEQKASGRSRTHRRQAHSEPLANLASSQPEIMAERPVNREVSQGKVSGRRRSKTMDQPFKATNGVGLRQPLSNSRKRANTGPNQLNIAAVLSDKPANPNRRPNAKAERLPIVM